MSLNIKNEESQISKKKQKQNLLIGIFGLIISTFLIIIIKLSVFVGLIYMILFAINLILIFLSASSLSDKKDNSYLRINHLLIFVLQILKFLFLFSFMILFVIYAEKYNATTLNLIELFIIEYLLIFFVATEDNLRYIYFKLLELLHMKDWPYDKRYSISSKLYYDYHSEGFSYKTEIKNKMGKIKRISNSIDAFRLGHSSNIKIFGIPINNQIMKKKLIKLYYTKFDFETVEINFKTSWLKNIIAVITILLIIFFCFFIV